MTTSVIFEADVGYCYRRARFYVQCARARLASASIGHPAREREVRMEHLERAFECLCQAERFRFVARAARAARAAQP